MKKRKNKLELPVDYKKMLMELFKQQIIMSGAKGKYSGAFLDQARKFLKENKK